jgi:hypothetical protein
LKLDLRSFRSGAILVAAMLFVASIGGIIVYATMPATPIDVDTMIGPGSGVEGASYIIFKTPSGLTCAKNGTTGGIEYSDMNASSVIQSAIDNIVAGAIDLKAGTYDTDATIYGHATLTLNFESGARIVYTGTGAALSFTTPVRDGSLISFNVIKPQIEAVHGTGIYIYHAYLYHIEKSRIYAHIGIDVDGSNTGDILDNDLIAIGGTIREAGSVGMRFSNTETVNHMRISGGLIGGFEKGIQIINGQSLVFSDINYVTSTTGIEVLSGYGFQFYNCFSESNTQYDMHFTAANGGEATRQVIIDGCGFYGANPGVNVLNVSYSYGLAFQHNMVTDNTQKFFLGEGTQFTQLDISNILATIYIHHDATFTLIGAVTFEYEGSIVIPSGSWRVYMSIPQGHVGFATLTGTTNETSHLWWEYISPTEYYITNSIVVSVNTTVYYSYRLIGYGYTVV